ncbi:MAG: AI-2E family transporter [Verrucomicrobiota bacterium]
MADERENRSYPTPFQRRMLWMAVTGIAIAVVGALAVWALLLFGRMLSFLQPVLVPLALAAILAYLLEPVVNRLKDSSFLGRKISRTTAVAFVYGLVTITFVVGALTVLPTMIKKVTTFVDNREFYIERTQVWAETNVLQLEKMLNIGRNRDKESTEASTESAREGESADGDKVDSESAPTATEETPLDSEIPNISDGESKLASEVASSIADDTALPDVAEESLDDSSIFRYAMDKLKSEETIDGILAFLNQAFQGFLGTLGYVVGFFLVPVYLFFFLNDTALLRDKWTDWIPLRSSDFKDEVISVLREINGYLVAFFRGQVIVSFIDGALTGIALLFLGLEGALIIGLFLAILGVIPFVGIILTMIPAVLLAIAQFGTLHHPIIVVIIFIVVQQIDGFFIQPKIVGEAVGLHPMTVIFSIVFWSLIIGGLLGALMAVPLTAAVKVLFQRYIWEPRVNPNHKDPEPAPA